MYNIKHKKINVLLYVNLYKSETNNLNQNIYSSTNLCFII
jgi:hypothetical protein